METSVFVKTMGDYPLIKVLDFLIENREFDYSITDIAKQVGINFLTLKSIWPQVERLLIRTRNIGNAELFKLDLSNPVVEKLIEFDEFITELAAQKAIEEELAVKAEA